MAVPQNRKTSRQSGEIHRRHHVSADGFYRGRKVIETKD